MAMQVTNPNKNAQIRLAELEVLDERWLMTQQRLEIFTKPKWLEHSTSELNFARLMLVTCF